MIKIYVAFFTCRVIPESVRWLISKNRNDEAKKLIQIAAKENKVTISDEQLDTLLNVNENMNDGNSNKKRASVLDIFRHENMRKRSLIIFFDW